MGQGLDLTAGSANDVSGTGQEYEMGFREQQRAKAKHRVLEVSKRLISQGKILQGRGCSGVFPLRRKDCEEVPGGVDSGGGIEHPRWAGPTAAGQGDENCGSYRGEYVAASYCERGDDIREGAADSGANGHI
jgi:hypothetical protein